MKTKSRKAKLTSPFQGPLEVLKKTKDIYELKDVKTSKIFTRHTSSLKPYIIAALMILSILITGMGSEDVDQWTTSRPLIWFKTKNQVDVGIIEFDVMYKYISPCDVYQTNLTSELQALDPDRTAPLGDKPVPPKASNYGPRSYDLAVQEYRIRLIEYEEKK